MRIGVIGCGYWGKIIINNLIQLQYDDLVLCDTKEILDGLNLGRKFKKETDYRKVKCEKVFVLVPVSYHYEVCHHFLSKGTDVFCEKVLTPKTKEAKNLYELARSNDCNLFVDWVFTFNSEVNHIKSIYEKGLLGRIKHATMNRQNYGPLRNDVDARFDLASHDLSILLHVFKQKVKKAEWNNYKRNPIGSQCDSTLAFLEFKDYTATINASWEYSKKDRKCFFDFEKGFVEWDDTAKVLNIESDCDIISSERESSSPLHKSLLGFLKNGGFDYACQEEMTIDIISSLNAEGM